MLVSTLVIAAFGASTTFATPLLGSLGGSRVDIGHQDDSVPHLHGRDVNKAGKTELPTCHRDNLFRLFVGPDHAVAANAFCSVYIASSSLVRATVTPTYTATLNITATGALASGIATATGGVTNTNATVNATAPIETCSSNNATVISATGSAPSATASVVSPPVKRQGPPVPPADAGAYSALRLSSVCSCLVTPSTIITTLTETASAEYTTETCTVQATANVPPFHNTSASDIAPGPQTSSGTAVSTATLSITANNTAGASATVSIPPLGTADATASLSSSLNSTTNATATISSAPNSTANVTATLSLSRNSTGTATFPGPTGTNLPSSSAAYCNQNFIRGNGTFLARYMVRCGYSYVNLNPVRIESRPSYETCVQECDNDSRCYGYSFLLSGDGENCYIYNYYPLPAGQVDPLFDSGSYVVGSNNGMKR